MEFKLKTSDEELHDRFYALNDLEDLADLLEVKSGLLKYLLYVGSKQSKYTTFSVPKKSAGMRQISAPITSLKIVQSRLAQVLTAVYSVKQNVHGFVRERSIVTNAQIHVGQNYMLNVDLKDFFPSINFGRVRGMFMANPYVLNSSIATILAQVCCFENQLPQGAPTSPIVSNMICARLDSQLKWLAEKYGCLYSRYADDLTFSTSRPLFPNALASRGIGGQQYKAGFMLNKIVQKNGFQINPNKVRVQHTTERQEVTGLVSNEKVNVPREYVRQIRAMLYAWEKFGLRAAEREHIKRYEFKYREPHKRLPSYRDIVKGKLQFLGMVKGKDDPVFKRYWDQFEKLDLKFGRPRKRTIKQEKELSLEKQASIDFKNWLDSLPYPLAIILWNYYATSESDGEKRYRQLLHFFEALTEFMAAILLSAILNDDELFEKLKEKIAQSSNGSDSPWKTPTFGTWHMTYAIVAKELRTMINGKSEDKNRCRNLFKTKNDQVIKKLTSKEWPEIFGEANEWRNKWTGHGGITSAQEAHRRHEILKNHLEKVHELFDDMWLTYELIRTRSMVKENQQLFHTVELVMGRSTPFQIIRIPIRQELDSRELHLVSRADKSALPLLRLINFGQSSESTSTASYFYNRVEDAKTRSLRYVSYHFESESEITLLDPGLIKILQLLQ